MTGIIISLFAVGFVFLKDCEGSRTSGIIATVWSLITSWALIVITYDTVWCEVAVLLSLLGGCLMFAKINGIKARCHRIIA